MAKSGLKLITENPKFGKKSLISKEEAKSVKEEKLNFSFLHLKEIDFFGFGNCSPKWHISFIDRLSTLSNLSPQEVLEDNKGSDALRCHHVKWSQDGIPIQRANLDWLPKDILNNPDEFPIMQFSVSTGMGRFVGFFDKDSSTFYIVLLDPNHNIQPAKKHNYQTTPTTIGLSQYDDLLSKFHNIKKSVSKCKHSPVCEISSHIEHANIEHNIIYIPLDNDFLVAYQDVLKKHPLEKIFENGILSLLD